MDIVGTIKKAWFHPNDLFSGLSADLGGAFKHYAIISLVPLALSLILFGALGSTFAALMGFGALAPLVGGAFLAIPVLLYVMMLIGIFINAAILHIFVYLMGGRAGYSRTFQALAYGSTPHVLLLWLPFLNILFFLWSVYNTIVGISILHKMTKAKALFAFLLPIIIAMALAFVLGMGAALTAMSTLPAY